MDKSLDALDKRILKLLQEDAALSLDTMAENLHSTRNTLWRRIARLEEAGVIAKRVALVDPAAINLGLSVFIALRAGKHDKAWAEQFRAVLADLPEIIGAYRTAGEIDYVLHARVSDVAAYDRLYQRLITRIELADCSASFVMEELKNVTQLPLDFA